MHAYEIGSTIQAHLNLCCNKRGYIDVMTDRTIVVSKHSSLDARKIFVGCTFVFDNNFSGSVHALAIMGCTFVFGGECRDKPLFTYDYNYYLRGLPGTFGNYRPDICYAAVNVVSRVGLVRKGNTFELNEAKQQIKKATQEHHESKLQFSYNGKDFSFSRRSFSAGVELEIPKHYSNVRMAKVNRRRWERDMDSSQICGDLEMVSYPASLGFYKTDGFLEQVRELYEAVEAPSDRSFYVDDYCSDRPRGSGIHIHIGWHKHNGLCAAEVRSHYYKELEKRGGKDFCLRVGGKSMGQFREYSPYIPQCDARQKYDCVHVVGSSHIELRWLANDPDPDVVCERIKVAIDIFEAAVLECYKSKIQLSTRIKLWTILPSLLNKRLQQPTLPTSTLA